VKTSRLPPWIRTTPPTASDAAYIRAKTYARGLATVCREARCPNQGECAARRTATFLILGDTCTRNCGFCAVQHGKPLPVNPREPEEVADAVRSMELRYAVITSVTRDDLPDGGASTFARTVRAIHDVPGHVGVEALIPDFKGSGEALDAVMVSRPETIAHNLETVPRLYPTVRQGASYERSLTLLERVAASNAGIVPKSGIMLGAGETQEEILRVIGDLVQVGCVVLTIGQYLQPTDLHHPVQRFVRPEEFARLEEHALAEGLLRVVAGPLVRSSYKAAEIMEQFRGSARPVGREPHTKAR
jgi:lipoyl synthase